MPVTQAQCAERVPAPGPAVHRSAGRADRHAAELALRPADRGRPDRGSDPRASATTSCRDTPPLAPVTRARAAARRGAARMRVRHALAALDYQETINFSFVEERWEHELAGNADPIRVLNPIAAPLAVMRSSLIGSLVERAAPQPGAQGRRACGCSRSAACSGATPRCRRRRARVAGVAPADAPGRPGLRPGRRAAVGPQGARGRLLRRQGRCRGAAGAAPAASSWPPTHPALHPGRCARVELDGRADRPSSASCTRAGARPTSCRRRRCCSSSTWTRVLARAGAGVQRRAAPAGGVARPGAGGADERSATTR